MFPTIVLWLLLCSTTFLTIVLAVSTFPRGGNEIFKLTLVFRATQFLQKHNKDILGWAVWKWHGV